MIDWEETDVGLRVFDGGDSVVPVRGPDIRTEPAGSGVPRPVDAALDCTTTELRFPAPLVAVTAIDGDDRYEIGPGTDPVDLPHGTYVIDVDAEIRAFVEAEGPARIHVEDSEGVVSFPTARELTLGFRSRKTASVGRVTVPDTPAGLADALTHASAALSTTGPERSAPWLRGRPPALELGTERHVPDEVADATPHTGIELVAPDSFEALFPLAPLAYYLGADTRVADRDNAVLRAPGVDTTIGLGAMPTLQREAAATLRKSVFLDSLVRTAASPGRDLAEAGLLDMLDLDPAALTAATPAERFARYADVPDAAIERRLPDWPLATYVDPAPENVEALPYLLDDLALIYAPETSELDGGELIERSLDDFYRSMNTDEVASVDVAKPHLRHGRMHGWLADDTPIDVFKTSRAAYRNRNDGSTEGPTLSVTVVSNDDEMDAEVSTVIDTYESRSASLPIDLTVRNHLTTAKLARLLETPTDFVHFIGHCEHGGLRCPDGTLDTESLRTCKTRSFFLNACGSYYEGEGLVHKGATAGVMTLSGVLNDHAVTVGSTFARLLTGGFCVERATRLARRRIMMGKDYAVVGDGTHTMVGGDRPPSLVRVEAVDGQYLVTVDRYSPRRPGDTYRPPVGDGAAYLCGNESEFVLDDEELTTFLADADLPVIHDGDLYWSDELDAIHSA
ncbi:hypothetical protein BRD17_05515 [Halobacteriales archaeon SW_7_68_16]|nr:MAG: hypothetical protein BRD17_05515 [Halobacteriales archaeon SW_7_68_16]